MIDDQIKQALQRHLRELQMQVAALLVVLGPGEAAEPAKGGTLAAPGGGGPAPDAEKRTAAVKAGGPKPPAKPRVSPPGGRYNGFAEKVKLAVGQVGEPFTALQVRDKILELYPGTNCLQVHARLSSMIGNGLVERLPKEGNAPAVYRRTSRFVAAAGYEQPTAREAAYRKLRDEMIPPQQAA